MAKIKDDYRVYLIKNNTEKYEITDFVGNLSWGDSVDTLAKEYTFDIVRSLEDKYMRNLDKLVEIEDKVIITNNYLNVFGGIITDVDWSLTSKTITCLDYGFYLNKSKYVIQFYNVNATEAIKQVCEKANIKVYVDEIDTKIEDAIFIDKTVAEIIHDILEKVTDETGVKYFIEMNGSSLTINEYGFYTVASYYKPISNSAPFNSMETIQSISKNQSIQDKRNSVVVISNKKITVATASYTKYLKLNPAKPPKITFKDVKDGIVGLFTYNTSEEVTRAKSREQIAELERRRELNVSKRVNKVLSSGRVANFGKEKELFDKQKEHRETSFKNYEEKLRVKATTPVEIDFAREFGLPSVEEVTVKHINYHQEFTDDLEVKATIQDEENVEKVGILQEIIKVENKDESQAVIIANNKLAELNKIKETISLEVFGSDDLSSGRLVRISNDKFDIEDGLFLILSTSHTFTNNIHRVSLEVERWI